MSPNSTKITHNIYDVSSDCLCIAPDHGFGGSGASVIGTMVPLSSSLRTLARGRMSTRCLFVDSASDELGRLREATCDEDDDDDAAVGGAKA